MVNSTPKRIRDRNEKFQLRARLHRRGTYSRQRRKTFYPPQFSYLCHVMGYLGRGWTKPSTPGDSKFGLRVRRQEESKSHLCKTYRNTVNLFSGSMDEHRHETQRTGKGG